MTHFHRNSPLMGEESGSGRVPQGASLTDLPRKALSIMQPWTWLLANAHKPIGNRNWWCSYRGPVLLHAGKRVDRDAMDSLREGYHPVTYDDLKLDLPETFETGGIVGIATITDCVRASPSPWFVGRYGIVMADARPLPFRPCKGALGFFVPTFDPAATETPDPKTRAPAPGGRG